MGKRILVQVGRERGVAELFEDAAPETVAAVWASLPLHGVINHANFSGEEVSIATPEVIRKRENELYETAPGDLGYFVSGPAICIYYGDLRVISPGSVFGRVVENLEGIQREARRTWKERGVKMSFARLEAEA